MKVAPVRVVNHLNHTSYIIEPYIKEPVIVDIMRWGMVAYPCP